MKKNELNFVLYDLETTGTSRGYDQILQCAAVLTNDRFEVLDRIDLRCRRLKHVVPSPEALLVTNISPELLENAELSHYELVRQIFLKFRQWSPATFCAHNGIGFDEHHLRAALFQTLHGPYLTQLNGNRRADSMLLARAISIFAPDAITVPISNGNRTFRLGHLALANGIPFDPDAAHDAEVDVETLRRLMAFMTKRAPTLMDSLISGSQRSAALKAIQSNQYFRFSAVHSAANVSRICTAIASAPSNPNIIAIADLGFDPDDLRRLDDTGLTLALKASPRKIRIIRLNQLPVVTPVGAFPDEPKVEIVASVLAERACKIHDDQDFQARVARVIDPQYGDRTENHEPEDQIFDRLVSREDEALSDRFHALPWEKRRNILDLIQDPRLQIFGRRLTYAEAPDELSETEREECFQWQVDRILRDGDAPWLTADGALERLAEMMKSSNPVLRTRLQRYTEYVASIRNVAVQFPHGARQKKVG